MFALDITPFQIIIIANYTFHFFLSYHLKAIRNLHKFSHFIDNLKTSTKEKEMLYNKFHQIIEILLKKSRLFPLNNVPTFMFNKHTF